MLTLRLAEIRELDALDRLYKACIETLNKNGVYQWEESYPNRDTYTECIQNGSQYVIEDGGHMVGGVILNEIQAEEWTEAHWQWTEGKQLVIHAFVIDPDAQGKGYGQRSLELCEKFGLEEGYMAMRLDAFSENPVAVRLYEKNGYRKVGEVTFSYKPIGHQRYLCYEKSLQE